MAVKIRLKRIGAKKNPFYRVVVADSRNARDGRFIEELGSFNPHTDPSTIKIDVEKAQSWLDKGAQPTETVRALLKRQGLLGGTADVVVTEETETEEPVVAEEAQVDETVTVEADETTETEEPAAVEAEEASETEETTEENAEA